VRTRRWYLAEYSVKTKTRRNLASFRYAPFFVQTCSVAVGKELGAEESPFVVAASENLLLVWNIRKQAVQSKVRFEHTKRSLKMCGESGGLVEGERPGQGA
jgi:hypothetical protein